MLKLSQEYDSHADMYNSSSVDNAINSASIQAKSMAFEFDRKKKAYVLANTKYKQTGSLDFSRIAYHKTSDEIFKSESYLPVGKNHGVYVLLDISGSMRPKLTKVLTQAYAVVSFCEKTRIPFKVVLFTTGHRKPRGSGKKYRFGEELTSTCPKLLCVMSSKKSKSQNLKSFKVCFSYYNNKRYNPSLDILALGGTPLEDSLIFCYADLQEMKKEYKIENMTWITLTDGAGMATPNMMGYLADKFTNQLPIFIDPFNYGKEFKFSWNDRHGIRYDYYDFFRGNLNEVARAAGIKTIGMYLLTGKSVKNHIPTAKAYTRYVDDDFSHASIDDYAGFNRYFYLTPSKKSLRQIGKSISETICAEYA